MALSSLRDELSRAVEQVDLLTSQLDEARRKSDPARVNAQLKQVLVCQLRCYRQLMLLTCVHVHNSLSLITTLVY